MLQKNTYSLFRKPELSSLYALFFISLVALILFISTTNVYSAQVTLAWDPNTEPYFAGYKIYSGPSSRNYDSVNDVGNQASYTYPRPCRRPDVLYCGNEHMTHLIMKVVTLKEVKFILFQYLISQRLQLQLVFQATTISTSQINLSWNASSDNIGVTGYRIYRDSTQIATTSNTTYQDTGLSSSTTYSYTVFCLRCGRK